MSSSNVNKIFGSVVLDDARDLDFVLDTPLPLAWQRTYVSRNADTGWLGQGWTVPLSFRLEAVEAGIDFIDTQGRRTAFPELGIGESFFSLYEHTTLLRTARNAYELITPEGVRLCFGPAPSELAFIAVRDAAEAAEAAKLARAAEGFAAWRREAGLPPLDAVAYTPDTAPQLERYVLQQLIDANDHWLRLHYSTDDRPQVIESSDGRHIGFVFDAGDSGDPDAARLRQVLHLHGVPDERGHFAASSVLVEYRYSADRDLVAVIDDTGATVREFAWDKHLLVSQGEPGGAASQFCWDALSPDGRVTREQHASGDIHTLHYDRTNRRTTLTDASGRQTTYHYNADQRYTGYTDAEGASVRFVLDAYGQRTATVDALGRRTRYDYDAAGNLVTITQPDGSRYTLGYTAQRKLAWITDPLDRTTRYRYDARGNRIETVAPDGAVTCYDVGSEGWPLRITDARGGTAELSYDAAGRLIAYRDCVGSLTRYAYDERGNLLRITDALDQVTHYQYQRINREDRLVTLTTPDGATERLAYDALGRLIAHHDANGAATRYTLDTEGRPLRRENALGHTLGYQYDVHGRLLALTNENGAVYRFAWDKADRLVAELGFDARRQDYRYNAAGELIEAADGVPYDAPLLAPGVAGLLRTRFERDALGRLLRKIAVKPQPGEKPAVSTSRYRYDAAGQLIQARNPQARVDLHYTAGGYLAREVLHARGGVTSTLAHTYDGLGNRLETVLPDGRRLEHHLYGSGHLDRVSLDGEIICQFERDRLHRETVRTQGALRSYYERDAVGRLRTSQARREIPLPASLVPPGHGREAPSSRKGHGADSTSRSAPTEPTIARHYHYDRAGQLLAIDDARQGRTLYRYDNTGRLLAAHSRHARETFAFDPASNLLDPDTPPGAQSQAADPTAKRTWTEAEWQAYVRENIANPDFNPLLTPEEIAADPRHWGEVRPNRLTVYQQHRYRYDRWGNCIEKKSGAHEVRSFVWDAEHQLTQARVTRIERGELVTEHWGYDYDPFGRRIAKYRLQLAADIPIAGQSDAKANRSRTSSAKISETAAASVYAAHQRAQSKRALRQRDRARHKSDTTCFGWDGNRLLREACGGQQTVYLYEPDSFVPLALMRSDSMPDSNRQSPIATSEQRRVSGLAVHSQGASANARPAQHLPEARTPRQSGGRETEGDDLAGLPLEIRQLKDSQPAHWALAEKRRQKLQQRLNAQLGITAEIIPPRPVAEIFYVHTDHLGTPRELTDVDGHLVWAAIYKAWGAATVTNPARRHIHAVGNALIESWEDQAQPITQNLRFQGQYFDTETELHYNRFRYYDTAVGRFFSQDPIGLSGGAGIYLYAPNPVAWIDPSGLTRGQGILPKNHSARNTKILPCRIGRGGVVVSEPGARKTDYLFENKNDAMNAASRMLGPGATRTYNDKGQWNGWINARGDSVYWNHGDWAKNIGTSTFPHLNYEVGGTKGHLFMKDKIVNSGMSDAFTSHYPSLSRGCG